MAYIIISPIVLLFNYLADPSFDFLQFLIAWIITVFGWTAIEKTLALIVLFRHSKLYYGTKPYTAIMASWKSLYLRSEEGKLYSVFIHQPSTKFKDGIPRLRYKPELVSIRDRKTFIFMTELLVPSIWIGLGYFTYANWPTWNDWHAIILGAILGIPFLIYGMLCMLIINLGGSFEFHFDGDAETWYWYIDDTGHIFGIYAYRHSLNEPGDPTKKHFISFIRLILSRMTPCKTLNCNHDQQSMSTPPEEDKKPEIGSI